MSDSSSSPDLKALEARLAYVEKRLGRFRAMFVLLLVLAAGTPVTLLLWPRDEVVAKAFVVRDDDGRVRGVLGLSGGAVAMTLLDSTGQMRADVGVAEGGTPSLLLLSGAGVPVASLTLQADGAPFLRLTEPSNAHRIWLRTGDRQGALVGLLGEDSSS